MILDEGTSALDGINEKNVLDNLEKYSDIPFIIMIAHRVETLEKAREVYKITKGEAERVDEENIHTVLKSIEAAEKMIEEFKDEELTEIENEGELFSEKRADFSENESDSQKSDAKYEWKWGYFLRLLKINKKYKKHYIIGVLSAIFLGAIFPSFSVILASLINIGMKFEVESDPAEM